MAVSDSLDTRSVCPVVKHLSKSQWELLMLNISIIMVPVPVGLSSAGLPQGVPTLGSPRALPHIINDLRAIYVRASQQVRELSED